MRTFSSVYNKSKESVLSVKQERIKQDRKDILRAIKKEDGIKSFSELTEAQQTSYKSLLLEMWSPKDGINKKGIKFLNESKQPLCKESTPEQIKKYFQRELKADLKNFVLAIITKDTTGQTIKYLKKDIEEQTGKKLNQKVIKEWTYEIVLPFIQASIKSYDF
jgi:hypothetical protein